MSHRDRLHIGRVRHAKCAGAFEERRQKPRTATAQCRTTNIDAAKSGCHPRTNVCNASIPSEDAPITTMCLVTTRLYLVSPCSLLAGDCIDRNKSNAKRMGGL
jgi:hypothetical protein